MKIYIFLFLLLLLFPTINSLDIGVSPANLNFIVSPNEVACKRITLFSDEKISFYGEDRWALEDTKDLRKFNKNSADLNLVLTYQKEVNFKDKKNIQVCIKSLDSGNYNGILIFNTNQSASIGIWVSVNVKGEVKKINTLVNSTEIESIKLKGINSQNKFYVLYSIFLSLFLVFILLMLLISYRNEEVV